MRARALALALLALLATGCRPAPSVSGFLGWQLTREQGYWYDYREFPPGAKPPERVGAGAMRVTYINHATTLVQMDGVNILTDPIYSKRASPFQWIGPARVRPPGIRFEDLPPIDVVVISHNHYDHLDLGTLRRLARAHAPLFIVPRGNLGLMRRAGIEKVSEVKWGDRVAAATGVEIVAVPSRHFSGRGVFDTNDTLFTSYVFVGAAGRVYFAGDTGMGQHFEEAARDHGPFRLAILPIGAYLPRWFMSSIHISPGEAIKAHHALRASTSVAIHFGTFPLADDGQYQAPEELMDLLDRLGDARPRFWLLDFGEGRDVP